jgi:hypothetical protein
MEITLIVVTLLSLALAGAMSIVAWRVAGEERRRSEARVAALAADIRSSDADVDLPLEPGVVAGAPTSGNMFTFIQPVTALPRLATVILAGVLVVGAGAALLVALGRSGDVAANSVTKPVARAAESQTAAPPTTAQALELVALGHERDRDRLTVRGIVRNPLSGSPVNQLMAVVVVYDRAGGFLTTGRALVQVPSLGPGGESTFLVTIPGAADVGRYRVSFRSEDRVISHVDIRS